LNGERRGFYPLRTKTTGTGGADLAWRINITISFFDKEAYAGILVQAAFDQLFLKIKSLRSDIIRTAKRRGS
jgi:hypothetical protein